MWRFVIIMLAVSLCIAGIVSYYASPEPDGLERVAEDAGFIEHAEESSMNVMPDYQVQGLGAFSSNALAGIIGVFATFAVVYFASRFAVRKKS